MFSWGACCMPFLGMFAWSLVAFFAFPGLLFGVVGRRANPEDSTNRGLAIAGIAMNTVHIVLLTLLFMFQLGLFSLVGLTMLLDGN